MIPLPSACRSAADARTGTHTGPEPRRLQEQGPPDGFDRRQRRRTDEREADQEDGQEHRGTTDAAEHHNAGDDRETGSMNQ
jgi:hypothetical protein